MGFQISKNLAQSSLASGYTAGNTTLTVQTGEGARFDTTHFVVAVDNPPAYFLEVTGRTGDVLTVDPGGYDGSSPVSVAANTKITEVITAGVLQSLLAGANPVLGTAKFSAAGGTIASLVTTGAISGVTRTGTGAFAVALTGSPTDYIVHLSGGDNSNLVILQIDPTSSYGSTGFTFVCNTTTGAFDAGLLFVTVSKVS